MWAVEYRRHGGPEILEIVERPVPNLRRGQALVRVLASCVSRIDARYMHGRLPHGIGFPKQVGFDAIGQVVDANGTGLGEGSWVVIVLGLEPLTRRGTTVEMLAIEPSRCGVLPPDYTPDPHDCALALGGLTALKAVRDVLRAQPGQRLLVIGAGGPVGLAPSRSPPCMAPRWTLSRDNERSPRVGIWAPRRPGTIVTISRRSNPVAAMTAWWQQRGDPLNG